MTVRRVPRSSSSIRTQPRRQTFIAVTKTYGGNRTDQQYLAIERVINTEFQGEVEKVEDAVLYIARRR